MTVKLAALDLDGTLLDPFGKLTPKVCEAVASLARRDLRVVLCTGRRYRTALPHAKALGLEGAMVVNNGVLVKDIASGETLDHAFLDTPLAHEVIDHVRELVRPSSTSTPTIAASTSSPKRSNASIRSSASTPRRTSSSSR